MTTTSTSRRPSKTIEERKAQAEALHASIATQVEQLRESGRWERFLSFAAAFHSYSLGNLLLILSQCPDATNVAGFRKWQSLGRQVRKGERGIRIFGYSTKTVTEEDDNGDEVETKLTRFPVLSVFDIGQTDLIDGAEDASIVDQLTGTDDHGVINALTGYLVGKGWTITREILAGGMNGYTDPAHCRVVIGAELAPEQAAKTLIHETAHVMLGHGGNLQEYVEHRGLFETEAESVAYVVAGLIGFDTSAYSIGYIAGWASADLDLIRSTAARVLTTAHRIASILTPSTTDED